jgi:hypothetical protein
MSRSRTNGWKSSEDLELREAMNDRLLDLVATDPYSLFVGGRPRIIEIHGARDRRLRQLEQAVTQVERVAADGSAVF